MTYYHGGFPGLTVGDMLKPPELSGTKPMWVAGLQSRDPARMAKAARIVAADQRRVASTVIHHYAVGMAFLYATCRAPDARAAVYRVRLIGPIGPHPDGPHANSSTLAQVMEVTDVLELSTLREWARWLSVRFPSSSGAGDEFEELADDRLEREIQDLRRRTGWATAQWPLRSAGAS